MMRKNSISKTFFIADERGSTLPPNLPLISTGTTDQQIGDRFVSASKKVAEQALGVRCAKCRRSAPSRAATSVFYVE
jgi:hypothetical protein